MTWVLRLADAADDLVTRDAAMPLGLAPVRDAVLSLLLALEERSAVPAKIGPYEVVQEVEPLGRARVFLATNGRTAVFLRCYPEDGWGPSTDLTLLIEREHHALSALSETGRAWQTQAMFRRRADAGWWSQSCPRGDQSGAFRAEGSPAREGGVLPVQVMTSVVEDAFRALAEIHAGGLPRGLHPRRVWLGHQLRVKFGDFVLARIEGQGTITHLTDASEDPGAPYRAPECRGSIAHATQASDVYALALSLAAWITGNGDNEPVASDLIRGIAGIAGVGSVIARCLSEQPKDRPTALEAVAALRASSARSANHAEAGSPPFEFAVGQVLAGRYRIDGLLGEGGFGRTWRAYDQTQQTRRVLKQFTTMDGIDWARKEFDNLCNIHHDRCARVWDISTQPSPGYLVIDYIEGEPLDGHWSASPPDAEDFRGIALGALEALSYLHDRGMFHRDIRRRTSLSAPTGRLT